MTIQRPIIWNHIFYRPCDRKWLQQNQPNMHETAILVEYNVMDSNRWRNWIPIQNMMYQHHNVWTLHSTFLCYTFNHHNFSLCVISVFNAFSFLEWILYGRFIIMVKNMFSSDSTLSFLDTTFFFQALPLPKCYSLSVTDELRCQQHTVNFLPGALVFASGSKMTQLVYTERSVLLCFWLLS